MEECVRQPSRDEVAVPFPDVGSSALPPPAVGSSTGSLGSQHAEQPRLRRRKEKKSVPLAPVLVLIVTGITICVSDITQCSSEEFDSDCLLSNCGSV